MFLKQKNLSAALRLSLTAVLLLAFFMTPLSAQDGAMSEDDKILYALGIAVGQQVGQMALSDAEVTKMLEGVRDAASGAQPKLDMGVYGPKLKDYATSRIAEQSAKAAGGNKEAGAKVAAEKAAMAGATKSDSGLVMRTLEGGDSTGASPKATDKVTVHYHGSLVDGTVFDSSVNRGEPATFGLNQVIPCWTEGVQKMKVGQKAELVCPSDIAYGDQGRPGIPPGATLIFEVELISIESE